MVDQETQDVASEPAGGAPVNRDKRHDPGVIEGEVAARDEDESSREPPVAEPVNAAASSPSAPRAMNAPSGLRAFAAGALGGALVASLVTAGGYYLFAPTTDLAQEDARRLAALEAKSQRDSAALEGHAQRESATLAGLDKRLGALETADAGIAPAIAAASDAAQRLTTQAKELNAAVDAAKGEISELSARVAKLEAGAPQMSGAGPDLSGLANRIDKMEAALEAPKSETRVAPEKPSIGDSAAAIAIVAGALKEKLAAGAPFGAEIKALERLGVDPARLAALRAVVNGAPTGGALAASFAAVAPKVLAATSHGERGGAMDRFFAHIRGLVQVHVLGETPGDDPRALVSQIEGASRRGDVAGALATFAKLPESAQQAAGDWAALAGGRRAADAAVQSISEAAIGRLTGDATP